MLQSPLTSSNSEEVSHIPSALQQGVQSLGHFSVSSDHQLIHKKFVHILYCARLLGCDVSDVVQWREGQQQLGVYQILEVTTSGGGREGEERIMA